MANQKDLKCVIEKCEKNVHAKGMCSLHYLRVKKNGDPHTKMNLPRDPIERFWEKVEKTETCWNWKAFNTSEGYPRFYAGDGRKGTILAHRWIFSYLNGPIPKDMHVDHICRNRACVRPDHLRLLTPSENGLYAQQSCRWVAKSIADIRTLAQENVKSISVEKNAILELLAELERAKESLRKFEE